MKDIKKEGKNNKVKIAVISACVLVLLIVSGMVVYINTYVKNWNDLIYPGVKAGVLDLSGKTKEDASKLLKEKYENKIIGKKIIILAQGKEYAIEYKDLEIQCSIDETVKQAIDYGKSNNVFSKYRMIKGKKGADINIKFSYSTDKIDSVVEKIKKDVNKEPVNAKLKKIDGKFSIIDGVEGRKLEEEKLKKLITSNINEDLQVNETKVEAPIEIIKPKNNSEELSKVNAKISTFTTNYSHVPPRTTNIKLSTEAINGTTLMPGEEFSFNNVVGERTAEKGYQNAAIIFNNEFVDGLGGGICQTSSTLYCAMVRCNIDPTERYSHTIASSYVDIGQDATISWGGPDYKFINTLKYPIYIEGIATNSSVTFNVYSNDELGKYSYKVYSGDKEIIKAKAKVIEDANLPEGKKEVVKPSHDGHKAVVYREVYKDGQFLKKEQLYKVNIAAVDGVIKQGTKKVVPVEEKKEDKKTE